MNISCLETWKCVTCYVRIEDIDYHSLNVHCSLADIDAVSSPVLHRNIHEYCADLMTPLLFPQSAIIDILERLLTTTFYCWKFAPFCEGHFFLCIVAVCWWKNEAYTDWYYSILLLSVIINSVTYVTDDFIFAKMESITKLLRGTQREYSSKPLKHRIFKRILVFKR